MSRDLKMLHATKVLQQFAQFQTQEELDFKRKQIQLSVRNRIVNKVLLSPIKLSQKN